MRCEGGAGGERESVERCDDSSEEDSENEKVVIEHVCTVCKHSYTCILESIHQTHIKINMFIVCLFVSLSHDLFVVHSLPMRRYILSSPQFPTNQLPLSCHMT